VTLVVADTSTWLRREQTVVADELIAAIERNELAMVLPVRLELLRSARDAQRLRAEASWYDALPQIDLTPQIGRRAGFVQQSLAERGYHRGPSPNDLLTAAAAEAAGAELWPCDRHFELIADVTGQQQRRVGE
jgi:predicted nucleic acid-binding protein